MLRLRSASVGKGGGGKVSCVVAFDSCNWGLETCIHTHIKGMMSVHLHRYCIASMEAGRVS